MEISGNKIGDRGIYKLSQALQQNRTLKVVKCGDNRASADALANLLQVMATHPTLVGAQPVDDIEKAIKTKKGSKDLESLLADSDANLEQNNRQLEIDSEMEKALTPDLRMEKELRTQIGQQFGVPIERIRGTLKFPDYEARIPAVLCRLKDYLKTKNGFDVVICHFNRFFF